MNFTLLLLGTVFLPLNLLAATDHPVTCTSAQPYRGLALRAPITLPQSSDLVTPSLAKLSPELENNLSAALALAQTKTHAPAITAAVAVLGQGFWTATRTLDPAAVPPPYFYWGSAGKTFTAVMILQLIEEGKLTLATPLAQWFPDYPNAKLITVDHLLTHTSGIFSFNEDLKHRKQPGYKSPLTLLATAQKHGNSFCPGETWAYSNTGYVMLGLIIEKLDGRSYTDSVEARILRRLGLTHTRALNSTATFENIAPAHPQKSAEAEADFSFATPFGAGCIAATAEDMVRFWQGVLGDQLLARSSLEQMFGPLYPMFGQRISFYGRGVMVTDLPDQSGDLWLGHSGGTPGIKAEVIYSVASHAFVAVALNNDGSAQSTVNLLLKTLRGESLLSPVNAAR